MKDYRLSEIKEMCSNNKGAMGCNQCEFNIKVKNNDFNIISECIFKTPPIMWTLTIDEKDIIEKIIELSSILYDYKRKKQ